MKYDLEEIKTLARKRFNIEQLLPVQIFVIYNLLSIEARKSTDNFDDEWEVPESKKYQIILLPTGTGKTLCFQIPIILLPSPTLILYPLLSLIGDQFRRFRDAMPVEILTGSRTEKYKVFKNLQTGKTKCVLSNPETAIKYQKELEAIHFSLLVLDEAHCISKWGLSFRPAYAKIGSMISSLTVDCIAAFTATASDTVIKDICAYAFNGETPYVLRGDSDRANISYSVLHCINKERALLQLLQRKKSKDSKHSPPQKKESAVPLVPSQLDFNAVERPAIIFSNNKKECRRLALFLRDNLGDSEIYFYHAGLEKEEKHKIENWFFQSRDGILISTCAYGMGVDKANIRTVLHLDSFTDIEAYLQESGRAGRDRNPARAIQLCKINSLSYEALNSVVNNQLAEPNAKTVIDPTKTAAENYQLTTQCRRSILLQILQAYCENCSGCDCCSGTPLVIAPEFITLLLCFKRYSGLYSVDYFVQKHRHYKTHVSHKHLSKTLEMLSSWTTPQIHLLFNELLKQKLLKEGKFFWKKKLFLTNWGRRILQQLIQYKNMLHS